MNDQTITRTWDVTDLAGNLTTVTQTITVIPTGADLAITATAGPATAGDDLVYTVTVENLGPDPATGVVVTTAAMTGATTVGCTFKKRRAK